MYINNCLSEHEQKIVCAHELGHAILHTKLNILFLESNTHFIKNRYEIEANTFAAELLINNAVLQKYQNLTLDQIAAAENLPIDLLKLKLKIIWVFFKLVSENYSNKVFCCILSNNKTTTISRAFEHQPLNILYLCIIAQVNLSQ